MNYFSFGRQCLQLLAGERKSFLIFIILSVCAALTEGVGVALLAPLIDAGTGKSFASVPILGSVVALFSDYSPSGRIQILVAVIAVVVLVRSCLQFSVDALGATIPLRLERELNLRGYSALMGVEISYIHETEYGTLLNAVNGWSRRVTLMLSSAAVVIWNLMTVIVYLTLMVSMSWQLTLFALGFLFLISILLKWLTSSQIRRAGERLTTAEGQVNQVIMESITGMKAVRLAVAESHMMGHYSTALNEAVRNQRISAAYQAMVSPLLAACAGLFICMLLFFSASTQTGDASAWLSPILLFLFLLFRLMGPVSNINSARSRIVGHMPAFELINAFYKEAEGRRQPNGTIAVGPIRQAIRFEEVSFGYKAEEPNVIDRVSMLIERGTMVAIVGPSGAGKSTLIGLLARLYDPKHGRILVDGTDLRDLDVATWRRRLAIVTQDNFIFNDSVRNNIAFGQGEVSMDRIRAAADFAAATKFIESLPDGYDTLLGDRGVRLSGGQQQRIAIARAVLVNPDLLIFDEATSNLDTFTERAIQDAIDRMAEGRTLLVIAHRLSTIRKADKVIVLDNGRIVEEGPHDELLRRRGAYWEMVEHQRLDLVANDANELPVEAGA